MSKRGLLKLALALGLAIFGAVGTAAFAFFKEDAAVWIASLVVKGPLDGEWSVESIEYDDTPAAKLVRNSEPMRLRQLFFRVIGSSGTSHKGWTVSGYYNQPFLALTNVSASGSSGLGSYTGRAVPEGNFAFLGVQIAVNCKATSSYPVLLACPALLVRNDQRQLIARYQSQLDPGKCAEIPSTETLTARACPSTRPPSTGVKPGKNG
jgi:hypothetical protein